MMREIGGIPAEDYESRRADAAQRKLKKVKETLERRVAALEARPQGVSQAALKKQLEAIIEGIAPAIKNSMEKHTAKALAPLRKENDGLRQRICFLEGRESAKRPQ